MYGKLFASMFSGSLHGHWQAIVTFQQMIILADKDGTVEVTPTALSAITSIPLDIIEQGISVLEAPDANSRTPDEDGRRIIRINPERPWGWHITNYAHYRAIRTAEDRREYHKNYWHTRNKQDTQPDSTSTQQSQPIVEAKAKVKAKAIKDSFVLPDWIDVKAWTEWEKFRIERKKPLSDLSRRKCFAVLEKQKGHQREIIDMSIMNGWTGLFPMKGKQMKGKSAVDLVEEAYRSDK